MIDTPRRSLLVTGAVCLLVGALGAGLWDAHYGSGNRAATEQVVHDYLIAHPEVLPEAMDSLRRHEDAEKLRTLRYPAETPWPGAMLGNPNGRITLVEFTDFACGFCRRSVGDIAQLTAANHDLKVVVHELPILTPESRDAAKMALAAAEQGRYANFYSAMFTIGHPNAQTIAAAAQSAGLDMARARRALADPRLDAEIDNNLELARQFGFSGTPSWVVGDTILTGAVGVDALSKAITTARGR